MVFERARQGAVGTASLVARRLGAVGEARLDEQFGDPRSRQGPQGQRRTILGTLNPPAGREGSTAPATMVGSTHRAAPVVARRGNFFGRRPSQCAVLSKGCALGTACNVDADCDQTSPSGCATSTMQCTAKHNVSITFAGTGGGYVLSNPPGINCSTSSAMLCQVVVFAGESVTLTGYPNASSSFSGLSVGCSGNPSCNVTVAASDVSVTATFD